MKLHMLTGQKSLASTKECMTSIKKEIDLCEEWSHGLVLDGQTAQHILDSQKEAGEQLHTIALGCSASVACRLSPNQKQALIKLLVNHSPEAITLAVGDGANDVPMIRGAHIGIGIR